MNLPSVEDAHAAFAKWLYGLMRTGRCLSVQHVATFVTSSVHSINNKQVYSRIVAWMENGSAQVVPISLIYCHSGGKG